MDELDLSRLPSPRALRRPANGYRRLVITGVSLAAAVAATLAIAGPALAHDETSTPLTACATPLPTPLTTPCSATVTPPAAPGGDYTVMLPGIGTLNITIDPATNLVTAASVSGLTGFTASAVKVDGDSDKVSVTLTSTTDPTQVYKLKVSVKPPATAGGAPTVTAKLKGAHQHTEDAGENEASDTGEHSGSSGNGGND